MFGFGSDKEDRLKENMEEIKTMINSGEYGQEEPDASETDDGQGFDSGGQSFEDSFDDDGFEDDFDEQESEQPEQQTEQTQNFGAPSQQDVSSFESDNRDEGQESFSEDVEEGDSFDQEFDSSDQKGFSEDGRQQASQSREKQVEEEEENSEDNSQETASRQERRDSRKESEDSGVRSDLSDSIPEAPETKEIDVPEIDKGPLFIRQQKFKSARDMIKEMDYLSREIEEVVSRLEEGIRQDRKTESDAKELLHKLDEDRQGVKDIISPKQE